MIRDAVTETIYARMVVWEIDGWKSIYTVSGWGRDVGKIYKNYVLVSSGLQKPLTAKAINDLVRKIRQEVSAKNKN